ncbi:MAG: hypothetical protein BGO12_16260 [Verrucomicrobia bacterium 61-8]|nr:NdvB protein [Verrucomicrobiota bacterium]OJU98797.1 MAG: hypothetical protein BGO12_16260 [Verrucomicrobia bacterium 61-8]
MPHPAYSFSSSGDRLELRDPFLLRSADADLWNDRLYLQIDHRGQVVTSGWLNPDFTPYSLPQRAFYLRDNETGEIWSVPQGPVRAKPDEFLFSAGKSDIAWTVALGGIRCTVRAVVPVHDPVELWTVEVQNISARPRSLSLFSYLPFGKPSWLRNNTRYEADWHGVVFDFFPYYVDYRDYEKLRDGANTLFAASDTAPDAWMSCIADFVGHGTAERPDALLQDELPTADRWADAEAEAAAILQFNHLLAPGDTQRVQLIFGPAASPESGRALARQYLAPGGIDAALAKAEARYREYPAALEVATPDAEFDAFINHWLPRRSLMLARAMRFMSAPQGRNLLQDSMAGALIDPVSSRKWFLKFYSFQKQDGWLPHGMPLEPGASQLKINTVPHKDINSWGPAALTYYLNETGDHGILEEQIPFSDAPETTASLYHHVSRGLEWLLADRTARGLCRIGQGDWNDPLNMAGHEEKGESIWLSEALAFALDTWAPVCDSCGDIVRAAAFRKEADALRTAINTLAWDGEWYARGFTDAGQPFGSHHDDEGRIFLNAQSWAIISGAATPERAAACIDAVNQHLATPSGPMMLAPAYTRMRTDIGKLTQKSPGRLENGSVYSHAVTFYAYALYLARRSDDAYRTLRMLLSGAETNPVTRSGQLPLYIPNSYFGLPAGAKAGQSTRSANTGTAAWYYRAVVDCLFGLRSEAGGLRIDPQLPPGWDKVHATRRWRGGTFQVTIERLAGVSCMETRLDGVEIPDHIIKPPEPGTHHTVSVTLPLTSP